MGREHAHLAKVQNFTQEIVFFFSSVTSQLCKCWFITLSIRSLSTQDLCQTAMFADLLIGHGDLRTCTAYMTSLFNSLSYGEYTCPYMRYNLKMCKDVAQNDVQHEQSIAGSPIDRQIYLICLNFCMVLMVNEWLNNNNI